MHRQPGLRRDTSADQRDADAQRRDDVSAERDRDRVVRDHEADDRDRAGDERDRVADNRDRAADRRDRAAERRDERAELAEGSVVPVPPEPAHRLLREVRAAAASDRRVSADDRHLNAEDRQHSAGARGDAELDRVTALTDREAGDAERVHAEADRSFSSQDRHVSAVDRETFHLDELTGAYRRGSGFLELDRELSRAVRTGQPLAVVFVDVDHLKSVNDSRGHAAGDRLLQQVAHALAAKLRAYDLVMRYGGDEFVCVLPGMTSDVATRRLSAVNTFLQAMSSTGSVSMGSAEPAPGDTAETLVARADADLYRRRSAARRPD